MTAPTTVKLDLGVNQEGYTVRELTTGAFQLSQRMRLGLSGAQIRKLVRRYIREANSGSDFHTWFLTYADPTGETAVHNVLRERGF